MKATNLGKIDGGGVNISQTISDTKGIPKESLGNSFFNARVTKFQTIKVGEASIESFSNKNDQRGKTALCNIRKPNCSDVQDSLREVPISNQRASDHIILQDGNISPANNMMRNGALSGFDMLRNSMNKTMPG